VADAAHGALDAGPPSSEAIASTPRLGDVLADKYRIEGLLGRGGMGVVLVARHLELGHRVAIKLLESSEPTAAARFLREAQACAQLVNDHIARVFDLGRLPNGVPYFVMEHLVGEDLSQVIARGPVPVDLAIEYMIQTCSALAEAHAAGVIHRDLKPSNLFVSLRSNGKPWIKVLDFGISKFVAGGSLEKSRSLTSPQSILGSPQYMSPEQIRASNALDARSDIWSLGIVLYELLTAQRPFKGATVSALLVSIATEDPVMPSTLSAALPASIEAVLMRCLEKDPAARFSSVNALVEALEKSRFEARAPVKRVPGAMLRWTQGRVLLGAVAACTVIGLCAIVWAMHDRGRNPFDAAVAVAPTVTPVPEVTTPAAPSPLLVVHCDRPLPPGGIQLASKEAQGTRALSWQHSLPLTSLCDAESSQKASQDLLASLPGPLALMGAVLAPPHPFYRFEATRSERQLDIRLARLARAQIRLELRGPHCGDVLTVRVRGDALGKQGVAATPTNEPAADRRCERRVDLPIETYGKRLRFQLEPASYVAPPVTFASEHLEVEVQRVKQQATSATPPIEPCLSHYCRD
jgi:protein kinase-like protein